MSEAATSDFSLRQVQHDIRVLKAGFFRKLTYINELFMKVTIENL
jgi:hypothetical protein